MIEMADTYMCRRCGALVANTAASVHGDWHGRVEHAVSSVENAEVLAAELRERGDE